ncbi:1-acyl-sn-glycerol-3-phosphate acyltransferase [Candidatus Phycosocius spiralis]|nr:1-acyl-sn-glycerol-3-phosphate acyltransferase [Candidatus Phycosocius spiralis]
MSSIAPYSCARDKPHIIDVLIKERAPRLASLASWPILRAVLYRLMDYDQAVAMADKITDLVGVAALDAVSDLLSVRVEAHGFEHIPKLGRCVLVANHPSGIADGIAAWDAIKPIRPDLIFYANADALRVSQGLLDVLIPVEWEEHKRTREKTRETLLLTHQAFEAERALCIFPAGRLARYRNGELRDPAWMSSAVTLARKNKAPIIPVHMTAPWSFWFHFFDRFSKELRDITLFKELLNKKGQLFTLTAGPPIPPECLIGDASALTAKLKAHVEMVMPHEPGAVFGPEPAKGGHA